MVKLKGIGWDHERCMEPLHEGARLYQSQTDGVEIEWDTRSLAHFGEGRIEELLDDYDLIVFDHPYCGAIARNGWMVDLSTRLTSERLRQYQADALGPCFDSYKYDGGLWALPTDAATQVACSRPDLMRQIGANIPSTLDEVLELGISARSAGLSIAIPLVPIDAICTFLTLLANLGDPVERSAIELPSDESMERVLEWLREMIAISHPASTTWNPIKCYDYMTSEDEVVYSPFGFGYTNYARGNSERRLRFHDIPGFPDMGPRGSLLGGAGIGVSARSSNVEHAVAYADFVSSPEFQAGNYTLHGGQPGSLRAWIDPACNELTGDFFRNTLMTMQQSYLRPAFEGFIPFFRDAGPIIAECAKGEIAVAITIDRLRQRYAAAHD